MNKKIIINTYVTIILLAPNILFSEITKGPYLTAPEQTSMTIMWESDSAELSKVIYWHNENDRVIMNCSYFDSQNGFYLYRTNLEGLQPAQKYFYEVIMESDSSSESYFYTSPGKDKFFTFVAIGDSRSGHDMFSTIVKEINNISPRIIISMGDLVHSGREFDEWEPHFFEPAKSIINHIPLISTLGDHETAGDYDGYNFYYYFRNGVNTDKMWFSFDYGPVHFVSLDYRGEFNNEMIEWFEKDMLQSDAKWKIVYVHRPTYNIGGHRSNWGSSIWQDIYSKYEVDIVFAGHSHIYERFYPMRPSDDKEAWPVTYITTGGAGAGLYDVQQNKYTIVSKSVNHLCVIAVSDNSLTVKAQLLDGSILDEFEMVKHNGKYSDSYLKLVKPQEEMDIYMTFAKNLRLKFKTIPTKTTPARRSFSFVSEGINDDVPFTLHLSEESSRHYRIEPIKGILKKNEKYEYFVDLYAKGNVKRKGKYFDPPLYFNISFNYNGDNILVIGRESRYYPTEPNKQP